MLKSAVYFCAASCSRTLQHMNGNGSIISFRLLSCTPTLFRKPTMPRKISEYRDTVSDSSQDADGIVGDKPWEQAQVSSEQQFFPTLETQKQLYNGIRYEELPICHLKATKNNTLIMFTDSNGAPITSTSSGREGFKNAKKKSSVAGQTTGIAAGLRALRRDIKTVRVKVKGLGPGRFSAISGLTLAGVQVASITDYTEIKELGKRPKKARRI